MEYNRTFIEVGGNQGQHTDKFVHPDARLFVFEPVQELYYRLWEKYKGNKNVVVVPFAVDEVQEVKPFFVAGQKDWGCSSLNEFNEDLDQKWPGRTDFKVTHSYNVLTIRLDTFCEMYNISKIDYLWIDAQGHDFKVLKSLGDKLENVVEGRCEAAMNVELYKNTDNQYENIVKYLESKNFKTNITPDRSGIKAECDVMFTKN